MIPKSLYHPISEILWSYSSENAFTFEKKNKSISSASLDVEDANPPGSPHESHTPIEDVGRGNSHTSTNVVTAPTAPPQDRASWFASLPRNFDLTRLYNQVFPKQEPNPAQVQINPSTTQTQGMHLAHDHYIEIDVILPMYKKQIADMMLHSAVAKSAYCGHTELMMKAERILKNNPTLDRTTWQALVLPKQLQHQLGLEQLEDNRYYHNDSHLVALFLLNEAEKKMVIGFGGTSSGKKPGRLMYRLISNTMTTLLQWKRNFHSAGLHWLNEDVPDCYIKAAEIAEQTQKLIAEDPRYAGYTLTMTGHSKGGAEAAYATLNHPSIPAFCFATPPLGNRLIKTIRPENIALAKENIHHYFVKHDVVPSLVKIPKYFWNISHIGKGRWLPAPAHIVSGPLIYFLAHMSFHECITDHTEEHFHKATDPVVKTEDDNNTDINSDDTNQIMNDAYLEAKLFKVQVNYLYW